MSILFDISPERRASSFRYYYRQIFVTPPPVLHQDVDLSGKTAIITGSNTGIGFEAAGQILDLGGTIILAVRDKQNGELARQALEQRHYVSPEFIQVWEFDLSSYDSVVALAKRTEDLDHLDIAILNAGVFKTTEFFNDSTGYEEDIQVNYLSTMLLAILLIPVLKNKKTGEGPGHISVVSSDAAAWSKLDERNSSSILSAFKQKAVGWDMTDRYRTSKLLGQLFLTELAKRITPSHVTVNCVNPGFCAGSGLARETSGIVRFIYRIQCALVARNCAVGARSLVHAVTTFAEQSHGQYIEDAKIQPMAPIVYKPEGLRLARKLYEETLDELEFASVRSIIDEI